MRIRRFLAASALLSALPAFAQTEPSEQDPPKKVREVYVPVETHDFDKGIEIDTPLKRPVGIVITADGRKEFPTLIEERVHFKHDLAKSAGFGIKKSVKATETEVK